MDIKDEDKGSGKDKRKSTEADLDSSCPIKKVCTDNSNIKSLATTPEADTNQVSELSSSSASTQKISGQFHDMKEKPLILTGDSSSSENKSPSIISTNVSLNESEVSISDINMDSLISTSCETSHVVSGAMELEINKFLKDDERDECTNNKTNVDSNIKVGITIDPSTVKDCLDSQTKKAEMPQIEEITSKLTTTDKSSPEIISKSTKLPQLEQTTAKLVSTEEKQQSEITSKNIDLPQNEKATSKLISTENPPSKSTSANNDKTNLECQTLSTSDLSDCHDADAPSNTTNVKQGNTIKISSISKEKAAEKQLPVCVEAKFVIGQDASQSQKNIHVSESQKKKDISEPQKNKDDSEPQKNKDDSESRKNEGDSESLKNEGDSEPQKNKDDSESLRNKDISEPHKNKDVSESLKNKDNSEGQKNKDDSESLKNKYISDPQKNKDNSESQNNKDDSEILKNKDVSDSQKNKDDSELLKNKDDSDLLKNKDISESQMNKDISESQMNKDISSSKKNDKEDVALQFKAALEDPCSKDFKLDKIREELSKASLPVVVPPKLVSKAEISKEPTEEKTNLNTELPKTLNKPEASEISLKPSPVEEENANDNLSFQKHFTIPSSSSDMADNLPKLATDTVSSDKQGTDSTFIPLTENLDSVSSPMTETDIDKKSEISAMEVDSTNFTPIEGSLANTPCESGETSPSTSTPEDSCQVSAAPSPLLKDEPSLTSEGLLFDENSVDTKEEEPEEEIKQTKVSKKKGRKPSSKKKKPKGKTTPVVLDEETRMSANGNLDIGMDEDSQSSLGAASKKETRRFRCEVVCPESTEVFTADKVNEYMWPLEGIGEHYFIQEHISQYLGIMSFKRKYPDLRRRPIESQEKEYLKDLGLVSEMACDLGLTAVRSEDLLDIMFNDFPTKYEELQRVLRERKERHLKEKGKVDYQVVNLDKSKMQEYSRKAALNASRWNSAFNREKNEERRFSFDLQTFTLHMPTGRHAKHSSVSSRMGSYPVAVLPGQYTDYCKKYSYHELRSMPLQSVLAGPYTAEQLAAEMQGMDSDDENGVASFLSCATVKDEPEIAPPVVVDPLSAEKQPRCKVCNGGRARNKEGKPEPLIICGTCRTASHPTCIDLTLVMIEKIESYSWQCMDCKTCAQCNDPDDEERMIFCDMCDRGYHIYCVGLRRVPNGRWHCKECAICFTCGSKTPSGTEHIKNADWQHEFKKDKDNKQLRYACTLCVPCDKYWKRRQFCSVCMKVYRSIPEDGMVRCTGCPKYVHKEGCSILHDNERYCNTCFKSRNKTALNHSRIIAAAKKKMATGNTLWK